MTNYITSKGVQQFSITIASGQTTGTATINAVGSGAFILFGGVNPSIDNNPAEDFAYLTLTNSTTITATRNTGTSGTVVITGCIIDGDTTNLIKSVQYGTISLTNGSVSGTTIISSVTNANTAVHLLGWESNNTTYSGNSENPILNLSGTTLTASRQNSVGNLTVGYVIIEFQGSCLNQSVQHISANTSIATGSYTASLTSVVMNNAISIGGGGNVNATTNLSQIKQYGALTSSTQFTIIIASTIAASHNFNASIVEFKSGVLNSAVQRGSATLSSATSINSTITSVNKSYSGLSWLYNAYNGSNADTSRGEGAAELTANTTVANTKATSTSAIITSWEIFEFPAYVAPPVATLTATGSLSAIGHALNSQKATFTAHGALSAVGNSLNKQTATFTSSSSFSAHGVTARRGVATFSASGSLSVHGVTARRSIATLSAVASFSGNTGGPVSGKATFNASGSLTAVGHSQAKSAATFSAAGSFSAHGTGVKKGVSTFTASVALSAVGAPLAKGHVNFAGNAVFSATGHALGVGKASFTAHGVLTAIGAPIAKGHASFNSATAASFVGFEVNRAVATFTAHATLAPVGRAIINTVASFNSAVVFRAVGLDRVPTPANRILYPRPRPRTSLPQMRNNVI